MIDNELFEKALNNDIQALLDLGRLYYRGEAGKENEGKAFAIFTKVLTLDPRNAVALNRLANCWYNGIGTEKNIDHAISLYRSGAELGSSDAQYNLAEELAKLNDPECILWYEAAHKSGDPDASFKLAKIYKEGVLTEKNFEKYAEWLMKAEEIGNEEAAVELANHYIKGDPSERNVEKGFAIMKNAAENGNAAAADNMAELFRVGTGVKTNLDECENWAKKAARLGEYSCIFKLAIDYYMGRNSTEQSYAKAFELFIFSAMCGDTDSMENAAVCYANGYGVQKNIRRAVAWYEKAALLGSKLAFERLPNLYSDSSFENWEEKYFNLALVKAKEGYYAAMCALFECYSNGIGVEQNNEKAVEWLKKASDDGYQEACCKMGYCCFSGKNGVLQDKTKGIALWEKAVEKGHEGAALLLGVAYSDGDGVEANAEKALKCLTIAAEGDYSIAYKKLGDLYFDNGIAGTDYGKSVEYYTKAYEKGDAESALLLGIIYQNGKGVEPDKEKATEFFTFAAENGLAQAYVLLGAIYFDPKNKTANRDKGIECYEKAIALGVENAKNLYESALNLAVIVETDDNEKNKLFAKLAELGNAHGLYITALNLSIDDRFSEAIPYLEQAKEKGHSDAIYILGTFYIDGRGVEKNIKFGMDLVFKAAELNNSSAQTFIGKLYKEGNILPQNTYEAVAWFEKASEAGDCEAKLKLADEYIRGEAKPVNHNKAEELLLFVAANGSKDEKMTAKFRLASFYTVDTKQHDKAFGLWLELASEGVPSAQHCLACSYYNGLGTPVDINLAEHWWKIAADNGVEEAKNALASIQKHKKRWW